MVGLVFQKLFEYDAALDHFYLQKFAVQLFNRVGTCQVQLLKGKNIMHLEIADSFSSEKKKCVSVHLSFCLSV